MNQGKIQRTIVPYMALLLLVVAGCSGGGGGDSGPGGPTNTGTNINALVEIVARAGPIVAVHVDELAKLDGSRSRASSRESLNFAWKFTSIPDGSKAELADDKTAYPSFVPDVAGTYRVQLIVSDSTLTSQRDIALVAVTPKGEESPTGSYNHAGLSSNCVNCHGNDPKLVGKTENHSPTSNTCQACHTPFGYEIIAFTDHDEVFGSCSSCHNNVIAIGKSPFHEETVAECDDCHDNTTSFLKLADDGSYDHTEVNSNCVICHNGILSIGKTNDHPTTEKDCVACHNTTDFAEVFFDHSDITQDCVECHRSHIDGDAAVAKGRPLVDTHPDRDDCETCHNTKTFLADGVFDHTQVVANNTPCTTCHGAAEGTPDIAPGKPAHHMPTEQECNACHTLGTFETGTYDHINENTQALETTCMECHDGKIATGKTRNHVTTDKDCGECHAIKEDFKGGTYAHADNLTECASCHNGVTAIGKKDKHIPDLKDCIECHEVGDAFKPSTFAHQGITNGCAGCHNGRFPDAIGKPEKGHLPTSQDCSNCHIVDGFAQVQFTHKGILNDCESCHNGKYTGVLGKSADHIVTTEDCGLCHTTANDPATGKPNFKYGTFDHTGIVDNCMSCHDGVRVIDGKVAIGKTPDHYQTTDDCSVCHIPGTFKTAFFDHTGIKNNCISCHNGINASGLPTGHLPTGKQDCSDCHNTEKFAGTTFEHQGIDSNCMNCHDGVTAPGKRTNHVPTGKDCSACHLTTGFKPATFDHEGIVDKCESCHDGVFAIGKTINHLATVEDCGVCHSPFDPKGFAGAVFDHTGIVDGCSDCHGVTSKGKPTSHLPTTLDCHFCHTTSTFKGGTWDHRGITGGCSDCHDGSKAKGKGKSHFVTNKQCNTCHSTNGWAPINFTHATNNNYPTGHEKNKKVACAKCHTNNTDVPTYSAKDTTLKPDCAGCHEGNYSPGDHKKHTVRDYKDCGRCHSVTGSKFREP